MRRDLRAMFDRQATWQRKRATMSWAEKLHASVLMRETARAIKKRNST